MMREQMTLENAVNDFKAFLDGPVSDFGHWLYTTREGMLAAGRVAIDGTR